MEAGRAQAGVLRLARRIAGELARDGAAAVVLTGSHATGDAGPESDVDIVAIGAGDDRLFRRGRHLVSESWKTRAAALSSLCVPARVGASVPGWRDAIILHDPDGIAANLQRRARRFSWDEIAAACDDWVAGEITGWAEEVHKVAGALGRGDVSAASAWTAVLAVRIAPIMAVHRRIVYGSENRLWTMVSDAMGGEWARAQAAAFRGDARAALRLYALAADDARALFDARQRAVVDHACALARRYGANNKAPARS